MTKHISLLLHKSHLLQKLNPFPHSTFFCTYYMTKKLCFAFPNWILKRFQGRGDPDLENGLRHQRAHVTGHCPSRGGPLRQDRRRQDLARCKHQRRAERSGDYAVNNLFLKWAIPGIFFIYFRLFKQTKGTILQQINLQKYPVYGAGIRTHVLWCMSHLP